MNFHVTINNRDFSSLPIRPYNFKVNTLSWSAHGGPDQASITAHVPYDRLLEFPSLLRAPITVSDQTAEPVWYGYINSITIHFQHTQFTLTLKDLFNKVKVVYTHTAQSNIPSEIIETAFEHDYLSQSEFGIKEVALYRNMIDDDFALALRDHFLELSANPRSVLGPSQDVEVPRIELECQGWWHTLGWRYYQNLNGYYANNGPGPGSQVLGDTSVLNVAQEFLCNQTADLSYVYFSIKRYGVSLGNLYARLYSDVGSLPGAILATSAAVVGSSLGWNFEWVKFTFATPYTLTSGTTYWIGCDPSVQNPGMYYYLKSDENMSFIQEKHARKFIAAWSIFTPIVMTGSWPDLYFRFFCVKDTGALLYDIANATSEFFTGIDTFTTNVDSTPYKDNGKTTLEELTTLMDLGTSNQRKILASVSVDRRLRFYEQPDPATPTVYLDPQGRFYSKDQQLIPAYRPPIGQHALLTGVDRLTQPFDLKRTPAYFVDKADYCPSASSRSASCRR